MLRFLCDRSVEDTAEALNCRTGTVKSTTSTGPQELIYAVDPAADTSFVGGDWVDVTLCAAGIIPWQLRPGGRPNANGRAVPQRQNAAPVGGRGDPAVRFTFDPSTVVPAGVDTVDGLAFRWADGAWVVVRAVLGAAEPSAEVARRVAEGLVFGPGDRVRMPFTMARPTAASTLVTTSAWNDTPGAFALGFSLHPAVVRNAVGDAVSGAGELSIGLVRARCRTRSPTPPSVDDRRT